VAKATAKKVKTEYQNKFFLAGSQPVIDENHKIPLAPLKSPPLPFPKGRGGISKGGAWGILKLISYH
jgi:hypothetical protein